MVQSFGKMSRDTLANPLSLLSFGDTFTSTLSNQNVPCRHIRHFGCHNMEKYARKKNNSIDFVTLKQLLETLPVATF